MGDCHLADCPTCLADTARVEHTNPEQSVHLLQVELDACRDEIKRLRATSDILTKGLDDLASHALNKDDRLHAKNALLKSRQVMP